MLTNMYFFRFQLVLLLVLLWRNCDMIVCQISSFLLLPSVSLPQVRTKSRTFDSVSHLIIYHRDYELPIVSAESALLLRNPVLRQPR